MFDGFDGQIILDFGLDEHTIFDRFFTIFFVFDGFGEQIGFIGFHEQVIFDRTLTLGFDEQIILDGFDGQFFFAVFDPADAFRQSVLTRSSERKGQGHRRAQPAQSVG